MCSSDLFRSRPAGAPCQAPSRGLQPANGALASEASRPRLGSYQTGVASTIEIFIMYLQKVGLQGGICMLELKAGNGWISSLIVKVD